MQAFMFTYISGTSFDSVQTHPFSRNDFVVTNYVC